MDYQRIFIILGLAVTAYLLILAWNDDYGQKSVAAEAIDNVAPSLSNTNDLPTATSSNATSGADILPTVGDAVVVPNQADASSRRLIHVRTDVLDLQIDLEGGDVVRGALPAFPALIEQPDVPFLLLDPHNSYSAQSGLIGRNGTDTAAGRPIFEVSSDSFDIGNKDTLVVDLFLPETAGISITKRFTFNRSDYLIQVDYLVNNQSSEPWQAAMFAQLKRDGDDPFASETQGMGMQPYVGGATFSEEGPYTKLEFDDIAEDGYKAQIEGGYISVVQHYFISAWVPNAEGTYAYQARKLKDRNIYLFGFTSPVRQIEPGSTGQLSAQLYIGPKDQYRLEEISEGLNLTVDYGFLWWLAQPLFHLLTFIHGIVGNWGLSIIVLTIIVKSCLYPLSAASFRSMAKMRKLQPEMARLKDRYGDDKQQFSQAMMELYKKEGANPLGGCLPILLQMPVFLALYWTLMESVELRHAPFILWIDDLSAMDPYFVLPILMGISMFVTQMLQPEPPDPIQAKVFKFMPIMFTFFFLWFPSGLVLYWFINNLLSIMQQYYVTRQLDKASK
ncbi:MAG: YidC/Oxa1 family membrane protein insertase [Candidatus Azotimanducaceae bacterium]|jgi:YidC/Oxa1 family membrane protein insertase